MNDFDFVSHEPVRDLVLAAGGVEDLAEMQEWLNELPADAYGQVFVEGDAKFEALSVPAGVSVNRVPVFVEPGVALAAAVDGWLGEWVWVEADVDRSLHLWTALGELPAYGACKRRMQRLLGRREPSVAQPLSFCAQAQPEPQNLHG